MSVLTLDAPPHKFAPTQIAGCQLWLAADRITGLADGAAVATWADLSGNGRNATQSTQAKQPLYKVDIIAGKPVVRFDGSDDWLTLGSQNLGQPQTTFFVLRTGASIPTAAFFHMDNLINSQTPSTFRLGKWAIGSVSANTVLTTNTVYLYNVTLAANDAVSFRLNGAGDGSGTEPAGTAGAANGTVGGWSSGVQVWQGDIAEIIVYNVVLATAELRRVERYLGRKYAIGVT